MPASKGGIASSSVRWNAPTGTVNDALARPPVPLSATLLADSCVPADTATPSLPAQVGRVAGRTSMGSVPAQWALAGSPEKPVDVLEGRGGRVTVSLVVLTAVDVDFSATTLKSYVGCRRSKLADCGAETSESSSRVNVAVSGSQRSGSMMTRTGRCSPGASTIDSGSKWMTTCGATEGSHDSPGFSGGATRPASEVEGDEVLHPPARARATPRCHGNRKGRFMR